MPSKAKKASAKESITMRDTVIAALEDAKGLEVESLDVRNLTDITDFMIVVTGTSDRHIKTLADRGAGIHAGQRLETPGNGGRGK